VYWSSLSIPPASLHPILGAAHHLPMVGREYLRQPGWCSRWLEPPLPTGACESCGVWHRNGISRPRVGRFVACRGWVLPHSDSIFRSLSFFLLGYIHYTGGGVAVTILIRLTLYIIYIAPIISPSQPTRPLYFLKLRNNWSKKVCNSFALFFFFFLCSVAQWWS
jgi:hypothetical protein